MNFTMYNQPKNTMLTWKAYLVNLILKSSRQHFISLIKNEDFDMISAEGSSRDHVINSSWSTNNNLHSIFEFPLVILDIGASNASMACHVQVVSQCDHYLLNLMKIKGTWMFNSHCSWIYIFCTPEDFTIFQIYGKSFRPRAIAKAILWHPLLLKISYIWDFQLLGDAPWIQV